MEELTEEQIALVLYVSHWQIEEGVPPEDTYIAEERGKPLSKEEIEQELIDMGEEHPDEVIFDNEAIPVTCHEFWDGPGESPEDWIYERYQKNEQ